MISHLKIKCVKIHPNAVIPKKICGNLAFDLHVVHDNNFFVEEGKYKCRLMSGGRKLFHTGLKLELPYGYGLLLRDRSGLAVKQGLHVLAGVIDSSYTGEICICLANLGTSTYEITEGDRIAQAIIMPEYKIDFSEIDENELKITDRGEKGFGASGK